MKSEKNKFISEMKELEEKRIENILKLMKKPFEELKEMKKYYYDWSKSAEEEGYTESAQVNSFHFNTVCDAIEIKMKNDEEVWDYLT